MSVFYDNFRTGEKLVINIGGGMDGERLDNYLCSRFSHLSRAKMQRIIKSQQILVNNKRAKPSRRVYLGDKLEFYLPSNEILEEPIKLDIIYEDDDIIALNKQPGILVHPARGNPSQTLLNGLAYYAKGSFTPDVIHRLDRQTSGVIVFSKNSITNSALSEQFTAREVRKTYLAIVHGTPKPPEGKIELPIGQLPNTERYGIVENGKYALTIYKTITSIEQKYSLVELELKTGRTHQIRVHLAHIGNPIAADSLYGGEPLANLNRCALHSSKLEFIHPTIEKPLKLHAPLPQDMQIITAPCAG